MGRERFPRAFGKVRTVVFEGFFPAGGMGGLAALVPPPSAFPMDKQTESDIDYPDHHVLLKQTYSVSF